jgi:hypothetical protein
VRRCPSSGGSEAAGWRTPYHLLPNRAGDRLRVPSEPPLSEVLHLLEGSTGHPVGVDGGVLPPGIKFEVQRDSEWALSRMCLFSVKVTVVAASMAL